MVVTDYLGTEYIGQDNVRKKVNFYVDCQRSTGFLPPLFLNARRGDGKSMLGRLIGKNLLGTNRKPKTFVEINGSQLKGVRAVDHFINQVVTKHVHDQECTLFLDEIDVAEQDVPNWLLSAIQPSKTGISEVQYADQVFVFDSKRFSFICATTNAEKLRDAFKNRLTKIELEEYTSANLKEILHRNTCIKFVDSVEDDIVSVCRGSPRVVVKMATENITQYCACSKKKVFGKTDWAALIDLLDIKPLGLENYEIECLRLLEKRGTMSLTAIAACLGLDAGTVRRSVETFLLQHGLMVIDGKRRITVKGQQILQKL